jgi:putative tryptophan/tyrosine transport system substrate-binding protein
MRRRDFFTFMGGAMAAWPVAARAQASGPMSPFARAQRAGPVIGFLDTGAQTVNASFVAAFRDGLHETGFVEGENVTIEYRWAEGEYGRLPALAAELARIPVVVLATGGGETTAGDQANRAPARPCCSSAHHRHAC